MPDEELTLTVTVPAGTIKNLKNGDDVLANALRGNIENALFAPTNLVQKDMVSSLTLSASDGTTTVNHKIPPPKEVE